MANKSTMKKSTDWLFIPVHKTRVIKELDKATLIKVDFDRSTILPKVFRRVKEGKDHIYYSLPLDFNAKIRISVRNEKTRRYEHKDITISVEKLLKECGLDKPVRDYENKDVETEVEEEVGNNIELGEDNLPF